MQCPICQRQFGRLGSMKRHHLEVHGSSHHVCQCGKSYKRLDSLRIHQAASGHGGAGLSTRTTENVMGEDIFSRPNKESEDSAGDIFSRTAKDEGDDEVGDSEGGCDSDMDSEDSDVESTSHENTQAGSVRNVRKKVGSPSLRGSSVFKNVGLPIDQRITAVKKKLELEKQLKLVQNLRTVAENQASELTSLQTEKNRRGTEKRQVGRGRLDHVTSSSEEESEEDGEDQKSKGSNGKKVFSYSEEEDNDESEEDETDSEQHRGALTKTKWVTYSRNMEVVESDDDDPVIDEHIVTWPPHGETRPWHGYKVSVLLTDQLKWLQRLAGFTNPYIRSLEIINATESKITVICEIALNLLMGHIPMMGAERELYKQESNGIRFLANDPSDWKIKRLFLSSRDILLCVLLAVVEPLFTYA